jgi:hypothetical protein
VICGNSSAQAVVWRAGIDNKGKPKILGPFTLPTLGLDGFTSVINTRADGRADVVGHLVFRDEGGNDIDRAAARWSLQILPDGTVAADDPVILDVQAEAYGANNNGVICGVSSYPSEATVWSGSETILLPWEKDVLTATAYDIGNHGTVVGKAAFLLRRYPTGVDRAVVWPSGSQEMVNLNSFLPNRSPLVSLQTAEAVNMHGEIVGDAGVGAFVAVPK